MLQITHIAATLTGDAMQATAQRLGEASPVELIDLRPLLEKAHALGVVAELQPAPVLAEAGSPRRLATLVKDEEDVVAALHAVIPHTGQEPRSEALEHLREHVIARKQEQLDYLHRCLQ